MCYNSPLPPILPSSSQSPRKSLGPLITKTQVITRVIRLRNPIDTSLIKMLENLFHETLNLNYLKALNIPQAKGNATFFHRLRD